MPCWDPCSNERIAFENCSENCPRARQNPARRRPRPSKIEHRGAYESPDATKSTQEAPKRRPRDSAEASKKVQKLPKSVQVAPKTGPRGSQTPPKTSLGTTKTSLGHDIGAQFQSEGSYSDFLLFLEANAKTIEFALTGGGHSFCEVLLPARFSCSNPCSMSKNAVKSEMCANIWPTWGSKIEAGASQVAKKTTKRRDKSSKTRKMRPRSA